MSVGFIVIKADGGKLMQEAAEAVAQAHGENNMFASKFVYPLQLGLDLTDKKHIAKLSGDKVLQKILKESVISEYKELRDSLADISKKASRTYFGDLAKMPTDHPNFATFKKALGDQWFKTIKKNADLEVNQFQKACQMTWNREMEKYWNTRQEARVDEKQTTLKKVKGISGVVLGIGGTGTAIAMSVLSLGAATPGVVGAAYGTYKASMECYKVFSNDCKTLDGLKKSILDGLEALEEDYNSDEKKKKMLINEVKAKASETFLGKNFVNSIKKLEADIKLMRKVLKKTVLETSRVGRSIGDHIRVNEAIIAHCEKLGAEFLEKADKGLLAHVKKEREFKSVQTDTQQLIAKAKESKTEFKANANTLAAQYVALGKMDTELAKWETTVAAWKKDRPASVKVIGHCFTGLTVVFEAGCAAGSMGASSASFVPSAVQFGMSDPGSIVDLGLGIANGVKSVGEAVI